MEQKAARNRLLAFLIPALILLYVFFGGSVGISLDFGAEDLTVSVEKQDWSIPYEQIVSLKLAETEEFGVLLEGSENRTLHYGTYENKVWGQYHLCIDPRIGSCIVIETNSGFFVLNYENEESTKQLYTMFSELLSSKRSMIRSASLHSKIPTLSAR